MSSLHCMDVASTKMRDVDGWHVGFLTTRLSCPSCIIMPGSQGLTLQKKVIYCILLLEGLYPFLFLQIVLIPDSVLFLSRSAWLHLPWTWVACSVESLGYIMSSSKTARWLSLPKGQELGFSEVSSTSVLGWVFWWLWSPGNSSTQVWPSWIHGGVNSE